MTISNFAAKECSQLLVPETLELINSKYENHPIDTIWAREIEQTLLLDSKEKILYGGSLFVKAYTKQLGKQKINFAPLYIHELQLINENDVFYIRIEQTTINPKFIESLNAIDQSLNIKYDDFIKSIPSDPIGFDNVVKLKKSLESILPKWNISSIDNIHGIDFNNKLDFESSKKAKVDVKHIYSNVLLGIFNRPTGSRGVITELTELSNRKIESTLLNKFFLPKEENNITKTNRQLYIPTTLSESQKEVFYAMDAYDISMVIGPPGTGKSHTIASLVIDLINNKKSVLVASKNNQAVKVISNKIENEFGLKGILTKTQSHSFKRSLIAKLSRITQGIFKKPLDTNLRELEKSIKLTQNNINKLADELISNEEKELIWGKFYYENRNSFFTVLKGKWIEYQKRNITPVWRISNKISQEQLSQIKTLKLYVESKYNETLRVALKKKRKEFVNLTEALKQKSGNLIESQFNELNFNLILNALSAWTCNTQDISKFLPLKPKLFDVAIIDEASQCDLGTIIPILYRAKKIIIIGDPKQLRHFSFLSDYQQNRFKIKNDIKHKIPNYRKSSLIDWTQLILNSQDQITFLDEHYRSKPDIISFSNRTFYDNHLKLMRETPLSLEERNLHIIETNGKRNNRGSNHIEAELILKGVTRQIKEQSNLSKSNCSSIGIISPFTEQVKHIKSLIRKSIELNNIKRHNILIGTPYQFQGEERDMIHLSFAIDNNSHSAVYNYLNKDDVFNVSISRARDKMYIYTSINYRKLDKKHLISQYLNSVNETYTSSSDTTKNHDVFMEEVIDTLKSNNIESIHKSTNVAGVNIDLAIVYKNKTYCIDLIGYPGGFHRQFTPENIRMLARMKQEVFFIPYSSWVLEKEKTIENLMKFITK